MLIQLGTDLINSFDLDYKILSYEVFITYMTTGVTVLFNLILIPFFIDIMVKLEDFETKSKRQAAILNRNFFFMLLNTVCYS
jgi:hypothetical protein